MNSVKFDTGVRKPHVEHHHPRFSSRPSTSHTQIDELLKQGDRVRSMLQDVDKRIMQDVEQRIDTDRGSQRGVSSPLLSPPNFNRKPSPIKQWATQDPSLLPAQYRGEQPTGRHSSHPRPATSLSAPLSEACSGHSAGNTRAELAGITRRISGFADELAQLSRRSSPTRRSRTSRRSVRG